MCLKFDPQSLLLATGSLDHTMKVWDVDSGKEYLSLEKHTGEVVNLEFSSDGDKLVSSSFDGTALLWDLRTGKPVQRYEGHSAELSNSVFNFGGELVATSSLDKYIDFLLEHAGYGTSEQLNA